MAFLREELFNKDVKKKLSCHRKTHDSMENETNDL